MAEEIKNAAIRNLQIFRNGTPLVVGSREEAKSAIEQAIEDNKITLHDGEPISVRYQYREDVKESIVRGLFGVVSTYDGKTQILWSPSTDDIVINLVDGNYTTGSSTIYDSGIQLSVDVKVTDIDEAGKLIGYKKIDSENPEDNISEADYDDLDDTEKENYEPIYENGLVTALNVKEFVESAINEINVPEYTISRVDDETNKWQLNKDGEVVEGSTIEVTIPESETYTIAKLETAEDGYLATYELQDSKGEKVGASINIPKDFLVKSGEVKTVVTEGQPYTGAKVGDKYIDFVINTKEGTSTEEHIYLPVNDLVDAYTEGNGIDISETNEISIKVKSGEEYIEVTSDGIATTEALTDKITNEAENAANAAVQGLGSATASAGKYISGIGIENGKFKITETELPEGDIYYGGKDVVVKKVARVGDTEAKNYIDTALDQEITAGVKVGFLELNDKLPAGSSLSEILTKILVKQVGITSVNPSNSLAVSGDVSREVGTALGTVTLTPAYTDGYYKASNTDIYNNTLFKQKNPSATTNGRLYAQCESGDVTFYKGTTEITDVDETTAGFQYKDDNVVTSKSSYSFYAETAYGASAVNSCNDNLGNAQSISIQAGKTAKSTAATVNFYYKTRVSNLSGVVWDTAEGYLVDSTGDEYVPGVSLKNDMSTNGSFLTSTTQDNTKTYTLYGNSSLYVIVPKNVTFVIYATTDATKTNNLFNQFKKYSTTNDNNVEYDIYIYPNNGSGDLQLTGLKYSSLQ